MNNRPIYHGGVISNPLTLARILGIELADLLAMSVDTVSHYKTKEINKKTVGAGKRVIHMPDENIKRLLRRINSRIFNGVKFPSYLYGSISDQENPRDYIKCAEQHCRASVLIKVDISNFFSQITTEHVYKIFLKFFNFSHEVSEILSNITTVTGFVPQGAPTSTFIANLCFFETEASLVTHLHQSEFRYSRLIDDITVSTLNNKLPWKYVEGRIVKFLEKEGFTINADKTESISTPSAQSFKVHGLCIGDEKPKFSKKHIDEIKKSVNHVIKKAISSDKNRKERSYHKLFYSTQGKTTKLKRVTHRSYPGLKKAMGRYALPLPDERESYRLSIAVKNLERDYPTLSSRLAYRNRYYKAKFRVGILSRIYRRDATLLNNRLKEIPPTYED
jgi:hypothetical protein